MIKDAEQNLTVRIRNQCEPILCNRARANFNHKLG